MNDENCVKLYNAHLAGCLDEHHVLLPPFATSPEPVDYSQRGGFVSVAALGGALGPPQTEAQCRIVIAAGASFSRSQGVFSTHSVSFGLFCNLYDLIKCLSPQTGVGSISILLCQLLSAPRQEILSTFWNFSARLLSLSSPILFPTKKLNLISSFSQTSLCWVCGTVLRLNKLPETHHTVYNYSSWVDRWWVSLNQ